MAKRSCGNCPVNMVHQCELDFGLDGYPPCAKAVVENCHSLQQLKAEIAALLTEFESSHQTVYLVPCHRAIIKKLRQLSAV